MSQKLQIKFNTPVKACQQLLFRFFNLGKRNVTLLVPNCREFNQFATDLVQMGRQSVRSGVVNVHVVIFVDNAVYCYFFHIPFIKKRGAMLTPRFPALEKTTQ